MTGVFIRERRFGHRDSEETQGRRLCNDAGRDWSDTATNHVMQRIAGNHQKLGDRP